MSLTSIKPWSIIMTLSFSPGRGQLCPIFASLQPRAYTRSDLKSTKGHLEDFVSKLHISAFEKYDALVERWMLHINELEETYVCDLKKHSNE